MARGLRCRGHLSNWISIGRCKMRTRLPIFSEIWSTMEHQWTATSSCACYPCLICHGPPPILTSGIVAWAVPTQQDWHHLQLRRRRQVSRLMRLLQWPAMVAQQWRLHQLHLYGASGWRGKATHSQQLGRVDSVPAL